MARPKTKKEINAVWFKRVLKMKGMKICTLAEKAHWSKRTINRILEKGEITDEVLDSIANALNVSPKYLAGEYAWTLDVPYGDEAKQYFLDNFMSPDNFPYIEHEQESLGLDRHMLDTLLMHGISEKDFRGLDRKEQQRVIDSLDRETTDVLKNWFPDQCERAYMVEVRESFWQSDADVHDVMFDYYVENGLISVSEIDDEPSEDPFAGKYASLREVESWLSGLEFHARSNKGPRYEISFPEGDTYLCELAAADFVDSGVIATDSTDGDYYELLYRVMDIVSPGPNKDPRFAYIQLSSQHVPSSVTFEGEVIFDGNE